MKKFNVSFLGDFYVKFFRKLGLKLKQFSYMEMIRKLPRLKKKTQCPLNEKYLTNNVLHKATITTNKGN